jgi:hypothetical protein
VTSHIPASRAEYGEQVIEDLSAQLLARVGRGYSTRNRWYFRDFYLDLSRASAFDPGRGIPHEPRAEFEADRRSSDAIDDVVSISSDDLAKLLPPRDSRSRPGSMTKICDRVTGGDAMTRTIIGRDQGARDLVDLWTEREGRSDLVLDAKAYEAGDGWRFAIRLVYVPQPAGPVARHRM